MTETISIGLFLHRKLLALKGQKQQPEAIGKFLAEVLLQQNVEHGRNTIVYMAADVTIGTAWNEFVKHFGKNTEWAKLHLVFWETPRPAILRKSEAAGAMRDKYSPFSHSMNTTRVKREWWKVQHLMHTASGFIMTDNIRGYSPRNTDPGGAPIGDIVPSRRRYPRLGLPVSPIPYIKHADKVYQRDKWIAEHSNLVILAAEPHQLYQLNHIRTHCSDIPVMKLGILGDCWVLDPSPETISRWVEELKRQRLVRAGRLGWGPIPIIPELNSWPYDSQPTPGSEENIDDLPF